jgi:hypothetical protein
MHRRSCNKPLSALKERLIEKDMETGVLGELSNAFDLKFPHGIDNARTGYSDGSGGVDDI